MGDIIMKIKIGKMIKPAWAQCSIRQLFIDYGFKPFEFGINIPIWIHTYLHLSWIDKQLTIGIIK